MPRVAAVYCVHHKPWLMMGTLLTTLLQDRQVDELFIVYNLGSGECPDRPSYRPYHRLAMRYGSNPHLSPFDERVRSICRLRGVRVTELEFENDHGLDSGVWYRFIQSERWRAFDYVLFLGEGALFTRTSSMRALIDFADQHRAGFIASGHEKRRLPKALVMAYNHHRKMVTPMNGFHDQMMHQVFDAFREDADFDGAWNRWTPVAEPETQNHVPDIWARRGLYRLRTIANGRAAGTGLRGWIRGALQRHRSLFSRFDALSARLTLGWPQRPVGNGPRPPIIHVNSVRRPLRQVVETVSLHGVNFHRVQEPEWFGGTVLHCFSRGFLEALHERLSVRRLYRVLEIPFSGTALEIVWGFMPAWLGYDKWFTDAWHRVRKHFVTHRREDDAETLASYINRYHRRHVAVDSTGDFLRIRALAARHQWLREALPREYFGQMRS